MAITENFGNVGIVHVGTGFQDLPPLVFGPDHEGIHGSLNVRLAFRIASALADYFRAVHFTCFQSKVIFLKTIS